MADTPDLGKLWKQLTDNVGGGMSEALDKLKKSSIGEQVQSWIGKGENKPVNADQVTQAIGQDQMEQIAQQAGTTPEQAAQTMAEKLPGMVDKMTPDGQLPNPQSIRDNVAGAAQNTQNAATSTAQTAMPRSNPTPPAM
ncbi:uncharacterized protein YidB (DUF937 family) [Catenulispora sp. GAS73]|uniref:YidB family protein n=1 Tax=Catenulispora sp. GAS73 TaxID=3156269 RepID=UPI003514F387